MTSEPQKTAEYAVRGIPEYWIVDPDRHYSSIGTLTDEAYQFQPFEGNSSIVSPPFPNLKVTAAQVLQAGRNG